MSIELKQFLVSRFALALDNLSDRAFPNGWDTEFKEGDHPRDDDGKFASGGGSTSGKSEVEHFSSKSTIPHELNGVLFKSYKPPSNWVNVEGQANIKEPAMKSKGKKVSAGLIMTEPDGRVWIVKPTNEFGGYKYTFPKGGIEKGLSLQATAIKETYEESGLKGRITSFVGDYEGDTSITRYYHAVRESGSPVDHGWESEGVSLVPKDKLNNFLNRSRDQKIVNEQLAKDQALSDLKQFLFGRLPQFALAIDRWKSPSFPVMAFDYSEGTFSEEQHPRDPDGKFAKKGLASPKLLDLLKEAGYTKHPDFPESEIYQHSSGHHIGFVPPALYKGKPGSSTTLKHLDSVLKSKSIYGAKGLTELLGKLHPVVQPQEPQPQEPQPQEPQPQGFQAFLKQEGRHKIASLLRATNNNIEHQHPKSSEPLGSVGKSLVKNDLVKIGAKKGSNEGGVYRDQSDDKEYYVKFLKSSNHAKNELLAAKLYQLAEAPTLNYHPVEDNGVASDLQKLDADNIDQLTPDQVEKARLDYATHAWLANWDAVGVDGSNIGANAQGEPINLDLGGSLEYRAQGALKENFTGDAYEWESLRDSSKNPQSAKFFKDLTFKEIVISASRVAKISDAQIKDAVDSMDFSDSKSKELSDKLIERRNSIIKKSKSEALKIGSGSGLSDIHQMLHVAGGNLSGLSRAGSWKYKMPNGDIIEVPNIGSGSPSEMVPTPRSEVSTQQYNEYMKAAPEATPSEKLAIRSYTGFNYKLINESLRKGSPISKEIHSTIKELKQYLDKASLPEDIIVTRRVRSKYAQMLQKDMVEGSVFIDHGFVSTDHWSGALTMKIFASKGAKGAAVGGYSSHASEQEILFQSGSQFKVRKYVVGSNIVELELLNKDHPEHI